MRVPASTLRALHTEEALCGDPSQEDRLSDKPMFVLRVTRNPCIPVCIGNTLRLLDCPRFPALQTTQPFSVANCQVRLTMSRPLNNLKLNILRLRLWVEKFSAHLLQRKENPKPSHYNLCCLYTVDKIITLIDHPRLLNPTYLKR